MMIQNKIFNIFRRYREKANAHLFTFSLSRFLKSSPAQKGFSLIELLIVVGIMGISAALMTPVLGDRDNATKLAATLEGMDQIKEAILGRHCERLRGDVALGGYVADMGALPDLVNASGLTVSAGGQPRGLWTSDIRNTPEIMDDDLTTRRGYGIGQSDGQGEDIFVLGWRGPYLTRPPRGVIEDGWKRPLVFVLGGGGDLTITSFGADGQAGGSGYDRDIVATIRSDDYLAPVAGYISPHIVYHGTIVDGSVDVEILAREAADDGRFTKLPARFPPGQPQPTTVRARIYYGPVEGGDAYMKQSVYKASEYLRFHEVDVDADGYFVFRGARRIPVGTERTLAIRQPVQVEEQNGWVDGLVGQSYKIHVVRGFNWLENMGGLD